MKGVYLKLFVDCLGRFEPLNDTEFGRLVRAALSYKATGAEPSNMGREALLWPGLKLDIDRDNEVYSSVSKARADAGKAGAASRWQKDGKNGKCHLPYGKAWQKCQDKDKDKDKDKEPVVVDTTTAEPPEVDFAMTDTVDPDMDAITRSWEDMGFGFISGAQSRYLREWREKVGAELVIKALSVTHDAGPEKQCWRYVAAILQRWYSAGYKTAADVDAEQKRRDMGKQSSGGRYTTGTSQLDRIWAEVTGES